MTAGPDGAIWFTESTANKIGRITSAGVITEFTTAHSPRDIIAGPDGALWFSENDTKLMGRLTTRGEISEYPIPCCDEPFGRPAGITAGPDGAIWFTEGFANNRIGRITPDGIATEYSLPREEARASAITAGPDGALWFTEPYSRGTQWVGRMTTSGAVTEYALPPLNYGAGAIVSGPDGALWFTEYVNEVSNGKIGRITTDGVIKEYAFTGYQAYATDLTVGPDGAFWFHLAGYLDDFSNSVGRLTTSGEASFYAAEPPLPNGAFTLGPDGALWFTAGMTNIVRAVFGFANLSAGKPATQSSTLPGTPEPGVAADGNTEGSFYAGSVTATKLDDQPWWQVDLGASSEINSVVVWNRTDCCASRLSDYFVFISDTPFAPTDDTYSLQIRPATFANHQMTAPNPSTTIPAATRGRYVRIQLASPNYLSLAEVQVFGVPLGTPPQRIASQSSTLSGTPPASVAIDGNTDGNFYAGSVTATNLDNFAWWQVDLGSVSTVNAVTLWNRTDCCGERFHDYWLFVSDTPFLATDTPQTLAGRVGTFASHQTDAPNPSVTIPVGMQARYVRVQLAGTNYLSLAEVQIQ